MRTTLLLLSMAALLGGCARRKVQPRDVEKLVNDTWGECLVVEPKDVTIEAQDGHTVRYTYRLRMRGDGVYAGKQFPCPKPTQLLVEMNFNEDLANLKAGAEVSVTQEAPLE